MDYVKIFGGIASIIFLIILVIALSSGSGSSSTKKKSQMEPFVAGQVNHVGHSDEGTSTTTTTGGDSTYGGWQQEEDTDETGGEAVGYDEAVVDEAFGEAEEEIEEEEEKDEEKEEEFIEGKIADVKNNIRDDIVQLVGDKMTAKEVSDMEKEIVDDIKTDSLNELKLSADGIAEEQIQILEEEVEDDEEYGMNTEDITSSLASLKYNSKVQMGQDLHQEALRIANHMQQRAIDMEKEILEKRLSERLGKTVHLTIEDDEVKDIDHLLDGLPALSGKLNFNPQGGMNFNPQGGSFGAPQIPPPNLRGSNNAYYGSPSQGYQGVKQGVTTTSYGGTGGYSGGTSYGAAPQQPNTQVATPNQQAQQFFDSGKAADDDAGGDDGW